MVNVGHVTLGAQIKGSDNVRAKLSDMKTEMSNLGDESKNMNENIGKTEQASESLGEQLKDQVDTSELATKVTGFLDRSLALLTGRAGLATKAMNGLKKAQQGFSIATALATTTVTAFTSSLVSLSGIASVATGVVSTLGAVVGAIFGSISFTAAAVATLAASVALAVTEIAGLTDVTALSADSVKQFGQDFIKFVDKFIADGVAQLGSLVDDIRTIMANLDDALSITAGGIADLIIPGQDGNFEKQVKQANPGAFQTSVSSNGVSESTTNVNNTEKQEKKEISVRNQFDLSGEFDPENMDSSKIDELADKVSDKTGDDLSRRSL